MIIMTQRWAKEAKIWTIEIIIVIHDQFWNTEMNKY